MDKVAAASLFVIGTTLWFYLLDIVSFLAIYGTTDGGRLPIYSFGSFSETLLNLNACQFALVAGGLRILGIWSLCMMLLLFTEFFSTVLLPFIGSMALSAALVYVGSYFADFSNPWLKILNPYALLRSDVVLARADFVNVFGSPVPAYQAAIAGSLATGVLAVILTGIFEKKNMHTKKKQAAGKACDGSRRGGRTR